ncbi:hypothetical protein [Ralstonia syzygii]|uniref:hypothetical protein n=1 Tax=Ralstonia syzygii TaxID=28097 RepID=UPI001F37BEA5|nr:hypothetical protein [Ralstonia syzygii]
MYRLMKPLAPWPDAQESDIRPNQFEPPCTDPYVRWCGRQRVDVVMVAMDGPEQAAMLNRALAPLVRDARIGLAHVPQYVNAEAMPERLRAALDPRWQGELPRTLILRTDGRRHVSSGLLTPQTLDAALSDQAGRNGRNGARRPPSLLGYGGGVPFL